MTGCTLLQLIAKLKFIPNGLLDTPLDRVRKGLGNELISRGYFKIINSKSTDDDLNRWNEGQKILGKAFIYPLKNKMCADCWLNTGNPACTGNH